MTPTGPTSLKLLLLGAPGSGKTTAIVTVVERLRAHGVAMVGFVTREIRRDGRRIGFEGVTLDGATFPLAAVGIESGRRVGPYGVTLAGLETVGLDAIRPRPDTVLVVVDEIGKMESFSDRFRERVEALLAGPLAVLGTVPETGVGFVKRVRRDPRVRTIAIDANSRDSVAAEILRRLARAGIGPIAGRSERARRARRRS